MFIPCSGLSPESDTIEEWVEEVRSDELCSFDWKKLPAIKSDVKSAVKIDKGDNYFLVKIGHDIEKNDIVSLHGETVKVYAISEDFNSKMRNYIRIKGDFEKNHISQPFKIKKIPKLQGKKIRLD